MPQLWREVNLKSKSILKTKRTKFYSVLYYLYSERKVLSIFKKLYRIKQKVYFEDVNGPIFARGQNFNDHLKQNKHNDDSAKIQEFPSVKIFLAFAYIPLDSLGQYIFIDLEKNVWANVAIQEKSRFL